MKTVQFKIVAEATPGLLLRLLQPFARRSVIPGSMSSHYDDQIITVEIEVTALPIEIALIDGNLRQIVGVTTITCS